MELQQHFWRGAPGCRPRPQPIDGRLEPQPEIVNFSGGEIQPNPNFRHRSLLSGAELTSEQCNTKTLVELHVYVSQRDATEKLAHQVAAQIAAADRRVEEASGDPHEEEKDEAHKSSKGHVSEPAAECPTSPESLTERIHLFDMDAKDRCVGSLPQHQTNIQEKRVKTEDEQQRPRPPD
ncbi:hypothetical protein Q8A73_002838 [Channa argus]|nr:hypothetical protein Q8A73_002838 [Channa argus]